MLVVIVATPAGGDPEEPALFIEVKNDSLLDWCTVRNDNWLPLVGGRGETLMEMGPKTAAAIEKFKGLSLLREEVVRQDNILREKRAALFDKIGRLEAQLLQDVSVYAEWREAVLQLQQNKAAIQKTSKYFRDLEMARFEVQDTFLAEHID